MNEVGLKWPSKRVCADKSLNDFRVIGHLRWAIGYGANAGVRLVGDELVVGHNWRCSKVRLTRLESLLFYTYLELGFLESLRRFASL